MIRVIQEPTWGALVLEDTTTGELSFQCVCGGMAMYWQRVVLTPEEAAEVHEGTFDADRMVNEVCKKTPRVADRLVEPLDAARLTRANP